MISNCVINLSGDKPTVLREAARVLRPGGRFAVSDVIADPDMDEQTKADMAAWTGCVAGALTEPSSARRSPPPDSRTIEIRETHRVHEHAAAAIIRARKPARRLAAAPRRTRPAASRRSRPTAAAMTTLPALAAATRRTRDAPLQLNDPETLYRRWEDSQWSPTRSSSRVDQTQWPALGDEQRGLIYYVLASLMVAEERITTKFTGLVAAGRQRGGGHASSPPSRSTRRGTCSSTPATRTRSSPHRPRSPPTSSEPAQQVSDAFRQIFDVALVEAHERLLAEPADLTAKVRFITLITRCSKARSA